MCFSSHTHTHRAAELCAAVADHCACAVYTLFGVVMEIYGPTEVHFAALAVMIHGRIHSHEFWGGIAGARPITVGGGMCPPLPRPGVATVY